MQARLDEIQTAYPLLSVNELRAQYYQLPPVEWGQMPVNMMGDVGTRHVVPNGDVRAQRAVPLRNGEGDDPGKSALVELRRWERFTLKRWGQDQTRAFEVREVPEAVAFEVAAGLLGAETPDEAQTVFQAAREALVEV